MFLRNFNHYQRLSINTTRSIQNARSHIATRMPENIEYNKYEQSSTDNPTTSYLSESSLQRSYLNEIIAHIYMLKGNPNPVPVILQESELNRSKLRKSLDAALDIRMPEKPPLERARRQLFRGVRENRKQKKPQKSYNKGCYINFKINNRKKSKFSKMHRGYLNEARTKVLHEIELERLLRRYNDGEFAICRSFKRFYENAEDLMNDVHSLLYRARCALADHD